MCNAWGCRRINKDSSDDKLRKAFSKIKEEFTEHLDAINENTCEIQAHYEYLARIEEKINKLNEKVTDLELFLENIGEFPSRVRAERVHIDNLSIKEQELFLILYTMTNHQTITYDQLGKKLSLSGSVIADFVLSLVEKGVPIIKRFERGTILISLDDNFRELQAKNSIVSIDKKITQYF